MLLFFCCFDQGELDVCGGEELHLHPVPHLDAAGLIPGGEGLAGPSAHPLKLLGILDSVLYRPVSGGLDGKGGRGHR